MTQAQFLSRLNWNLFFELSKPERTKVLQQYMAYFKTGRQEQKTEDQLVAELGSPALVAAEIISSHQENTALPYKKLRLILGALILIGGIYLRNTIQIETLPVQVLFCGLLPLAILFILGGNRLCQHKTPVKSLLLPYGLTALFALGMLCITQLLWHYVQNGVPIAQNGMFSIDNIGPTVHLFMVCAALVFLACALWFGLCTLRGSTAHAPPLAICYALSLYAVSYKNMLKSLATLELFETMASQIFYNFIWGCVVAVVLVSVTLLLKRKKS